MPGAAAGDDADLALDRAARADDDAPLRLREIPLMGAAEAVEHLVDIVDGRVHHLLHRASPGARRFGPSSASLGALRKIDCGATRAGSVGFCLGCRLDDLHA